MFRSIVIVALLIAANVCSGQCRTVSRSRQVFQQQQQFVFANALPQYNVRYFLAEELQARALAERLAPLLAEELLRRELARDDGYGQRAPRWIANDESAKQAPQDDTPRNVQAPPSRSVQAPPQQRQQQAPEPQGDIEKDSRSVPDKGAGISRSGSIAGQTPIFNSKCARCHTGDNPSSGIAFDGGISDKSFRRFVRMFRSNKDVPLKMQSIVSSLTPELKGKLTEEILDWRDVSLTSLE